MCCDVAYAVAAIDRDAAADVLVDLLEVACACCLDQVVDEPLQPQRTLRLFLEARCVHRHTTICVMAVDVV